MGLNVDVGLRLYPGSGQQGSGSALGSQAGGGAEIYSAVDSHRPADTPATTALR